MSDNSVVNALLPFCDALVAEFGHDYLREPREDDLRRILAICKSRGFPGHLGSIDCEQSVWKNCPIAWAGQFKGQEKESTVAPSAIADGEL